MKNKKIVFVIGVVLVILIAVSGIFYFGKNYFKIKTDSSPFLYSNFDDKIPEEKSISFEEYQNFRNNICVSIGKIPTTVILSEKKAPDDQHCKNGKLIDPSNGFSCTYERLATVCGDKYVIHGGSSSAGPMNVMYYGIFELK